MPGITEWITAVFDDFGVERSEVVGDQVIALDAAFQGGPGILQIAGTGSNYHRPRARWQPAKPPADGVRASATKARATGSASTPFAARSMLYDREEPCQVILKKVGEIWGTHDMDEFINLGDGTPGPDFAALAPAINELAEAGDAVAVGVLQQAAADLVGIRAAGALQAAPQASASRVKFRWHGPAA